jgi:hypothetical protein
MVTAGAEQRLRVLHLQVALSAIGRSHSAAHPPAPLNFNGGIS